MLGILGDHLFQHFGDPACERAAEKDVSMVKRLHRFVTGAARRKEHDGRGQLSLREARQSDQPDESREACSFIPFEMTTRPDSVTLNRWASASRS